MHDESSDVRRSARRSRERRRLSSHGWLRLYVLAVSAVTLVAAVMLLVVSLRVSSGGDGVGDARLDVVRAALQVNPDNADMRCELARLHAVAGRESAARREYERVLTTNPNDTRALYALSVMYRESRNDKKSRRALERLVKVDPGHLPGVVLYAEVALESDDDGAARAVLEPALATHPEVAELQYLYGRLVERALGPEKAQQHYSRALELAPDFAEASSALEKVDR